MFFPLLTLALGMSAPNLAGADSTFRPEALRCQAALLEPIPYTFREELGADIRTIPGGRYFAPEESIPPLASGRYLYNILIDGGVYIIAELDVVRWVQSQKGVWKHDVFGLDHLARFGVSIEGKILASGWLVMAFGECTFLSNGSGTRLGGPERVDFTRDVLAAHGVPFPIIGTTFEKLDGDKGAKSIRKAGHSPEAEDFDIYNLNLLVDVYTHPDGLKLMLLYEIFIRTLIPYTKTKTSFHVNRLIYKAFQTVGDSRLDGFFTLPIYWARTADGIHFGIYRMWDAITRRDFQPEDYVNRSAPPIVQAIINELDRELSPEDRKLLETVRDGFASLPDWKDPDRPPAKTMVDDHGEVNLLEKMFPPIELNEPLRIQQSTDEPLP